MMDYLDYLEDHDYDALPPEVRDGIDRATYGEIRELALLMSEPEEALPPALQAAFAARTRDARQVERQSFRWLPWLAAAGWLFFIVTSAALLLREPETLVVENTIIAPAAEPKIITVTDTLFQTIDQIRYRTHYDTVYVNIPSPAQLVYVRDTFYLPPAKSAVLRGNSNLAGKEGVLDFLFSTE